MRERPCFDDYYLGIAAAVSARGECVRRQVGAVLVREHTILATGYNGAEPGAKSCLDGACPRAFSDAEPGKDYGNPEARCSVLHAELNCLLRAGMKNARGATMYITDVPCEMCAPLIRACGIAWVVTPEGKVAP